MSLDHIYTIEQVGARFYILRDGQRIGWGDDHEACADYVRLHGGECVQLQLFPADDNA